MTPDSANSGLWTCAQGGCFVPRTPRKTQASGTHTSRGGAKAGVRGCWACTPAPPRIPAEDAALLPGGVEAGREGGAFLVGRWKPVSPALRRRARGSSPGPRAHSRADLQIPTSPVSDAAGLLPSPSPPASPAHRCTATKGPTFPVPHTAQPLVSGPLRRR